MLVDCNETPTQMLSRLLDIPNITDPVLNISYSKAETTCVVTFAVPIANVKLPLTSACGSLCLTRVYSDTYTLHTVGKPAEQIVKQYLAAYAIGSLDLRERMYNAFRVWGAV